MNILAKNLVNLAYTPMLLWFIGQDGYGVYQTANSFVFALTILSLGFSGAYVRFYTKSRVIGDSEGINQLNFIYLVMYSVVSLVALGAGIWFSNNTGTIFSGSFTPEQVGLASSLMVLLSFVVALTLFSTIFDAYLIANEQFRFQQTRQIFTTLATPCVAYVFLLLGTGAVGVAIAQLSISVLLLILNIRFSVFRLGMRFAVGHINWGLFKSVAVFSFWIFTNQLCDLVNQSVPNVILGAICGASVVAVFAVSIQIRQVFYSLSTAISHVFVPQINKIVATSDDNAELTRLMTRVGRYQLFLYCFVFGGFALLGQFFVVAWAGPGFAEAYWLVLAMTLPVMIPLAQNTGIEIQRAKNKHKTRSLVYLAMAVFNVAFTIVASPYLGWWAPAIAYIVSILLGNCLFMNWYYQRRIGLSMGFFWRSNIRIIVISMALAALCIAVAFLYPVTSWISFALYGLIYSLVYASVLWLFVLKPEEKKIVWRKVNRQTFPEEKGEVGVPAIASLKDKCCGCSACAAICPKECIHMQADASGFPYPAIDRTLCVECGKCDSVCPVLEAKKAHMATEAWWAYSRNDEEVSSSSSGGLFALLSLDVLTNGGLVAGAAWSEDCRKVQHVIIENERDLDALKRSKYVQSTVPVNVYKSIKDALKEDRRVLFVGTSCQTSAMNNYLGEYASNDRLLLVDVICHGVPSPVLWERWLSYKERSNGARITSVNMRAKDKGWLDFGVAYCAQAANETSTRLFDVFKEDWYMQAFLKNASLRSSCYSCPSKIKSSSDITLGDYWGIQGVHPDVRSSQGVSAVLCNSSRGIEAFRRLTEQIEYGETSFENIGLGNPSLTKSSTPFSQREEFVHALSEGMPLETMMTRWSFKATFVQKIRRRLGRIKRTLLRVNQPMVK